MIIFFGPAGAGKSVQGQLLAKEKNWNWISSGQLLRESTDPEIVEIMSSGKLVPLEKFGELFRDAVKNSKDYSHVILDGFPRKVEQAEWLGANRNELGRDINLAIVMDIPKEELIKRMMLRGRADDTPEAINERLTIYHSEIDPILAYLTDHKVPVVHIDGVGSVDEVHERVMSAVAAQKLD